MKENFSYLLALSFNVFINWPVEKVNHPLLSYWHKTGNLTQKKDGKDRLLQCDKMHFPAVSALSRLSDQNPVWIRIQCTPGGQISLLQLMPEILTAVNFIWELGFDFLTSDVWLLQYTWINMNYVNKHKMLIMITSETSAVFIWVLGLSCVSIKLSNVTREQNFKRI